MSKERQREEDKCRSRLSDLMDSYSYSDDSMSRFDFEDAVDAAKTTLVKVICGSCIPC